jgi:outer membrane lipoprotein-sorting protein
MRKIAFFILFLGTFLSAVSTQEVLSRYQKNFKKIKTLKAKLHIEVKRGDTYSYTKVEYMSKGKKLYMKAKPPMFFILVSDGEKAHFYNRRDNTVYLYQPGQYSEVYEDPIQKEKEILKDVPELTRIGKKYLGWKKMDVYEGKPEAGDQFVSKFRIWVDDSTGLLHRFESFDLHGKLISRMDMKKYRQFNEIWLNLKSQNWNKTDKEVVESSSEFKNISVNKKIDDSVFDFKIPEGAKIKDLTKQILEGEKKK